MLFGPPFSNTETGHVPNDAEFRWPYMSISLSLKQTQKNTYCKFSLLQLELLPVITVTLSQASSAALII